MSGSDMLGRRVLVVSGTRLMTDPAKIAHVFDLYRPTSLIHGGAKGADHLACQIAEDRGVPRDGFWADWATLGRRAGPVRNRQMIDEAAKLRDSGARVLVACFPGPTSRGTWDLYRVALAADLPVMVWRVHP